MYDFKVITKEQQQTSTWSGGTTTQLAIYPNDASYADRNFLWRLSTAVVEVEESSFTKLQGFDRKLMVLEGQLKLVHQGHHTAELNIYQQDSFRGGWDTTGYGKARDFNLMLKEGLRGSLCYYKFSGRLQISFHAEAENNFHALYCYKESACVLISGESTKIKAGDMLLINHNEAMELEIIDSAQEECCIICAAIYL